MTRALHIVADIDQEEAARADVMQLFADLRSSHAGVAVDPIHAAQRGEITQAQLVPHAQRTLQGMFGIEISNVSFMGFVLVRFKTTQPIDRANSPIPITQFGRDVKCPTYEYAVEMKDVFPFLFRNPPLATNAANADGIVEGARTNTSEALRA